MMMGGCCVMIFIIIILVIQINAIQVLWFYRDDCSYCNKMEDEWSKFESSSRFSLFPRISTKKININDETNQNLSNNYEIQGVPHIVKLGADGYRDVYSGERTAAALTKWSQK